MVRSSVFVCHILYSVLSVYAVSVICPLLCETFLKTPVNQQCLTREQESIYWLRMKTQNSVSKKQSTV